MTLKRFANLVLWVLAAALITTAPVKLANAQTKLSEFSLSRDNAGATATLASDRLPPKITFNRNSPAPDRANRVIFKFAFQDRPEDQANQGCNSKATGRSNSCYGTGAGGSNTAGHDNSFLGTSAGVYNVEGNWNTFVGSYAGVQNREGSNNAFFGSYAGYSNAGSDNSFFGMFAGWSNAKGGGNSFFGTQAGRANITGSNNAFFGNLAGVANTSGASNVFIGDQAGKGNTTGTDNIFFGQLSGQYNTSGTGNVFIGTFAGKSNTNENNNTLVGHFSGIRSGITNATAIGAFAQVTQSNSLVLGSVASGGQTTDTNVGIGTTAPAARLHVEGGDVYIKTQTNGLVLRATDGPGCFRVTVNNAGALTATRMDCP